MKYNGVSSHFSHTHNNLKLENTTVPFKCDGCKEIGIGSHYKCKIATCSFDLHKHCATPSPYITHPFYYACSFQFLNRPPGQETRYCNACEKVVVGFVYHCVTCGFDLHPCCAKLPMLLDDGHVKLYLYSKVNAPCDRCGRKGRSWSYISSCKKYNLHVACAKEMIVDTWAESNHGDRNLISGNSSYTRPSNTKSVTRIPSLKQTLQTQTSRKESKGKAQKYCEVAGLALQFVVSAILGDPTTLIAGLVGTLISK